MEKYMKEGTILVCEGVQDRPPPNMPLWYIDYFEQKILEKQQLQGKAFSEPPLSA